MIDPNHSGCLEALHDLLVYQSASLGLPVRPNLHKFMRKSDSHSIHQVVQKSVAKVRLFRHLSDHVTINQNGVEKRDCFVCVLLDFCVIWLVNEFDKCQIHSRLDVFGQETNTKVV